MLARLRLKGFVKGNSLERCRISEAISFEYPVVEPDLARILSGLRRKTMRRE